MRQIAIMNDPDGMDIRDFEAIKAPWEGAGVPIDWGFLLHGYVSSSKPHRALQIVTSWGRKYEDYRPFRLLSEEDVMNYVDSGFLKTIHASIFEVHDLQSLVSDLVEKISEPILTGHGKRRPRTSELWQGFLKGELASKFFAISNYGLRVVTKHEQIVTGRLFKRLPPSRRKKLMPNFTRLILQLSRTLGHDAILSTHLGFKYAKSKHNLYLDHVQKTIEFIDNHDIKVVDVRSLIKEKRRKTKSG